MQALYEGGRWGVFAGTSPPIFPSPALLPTTWRRSIDRHRCSGCSFAGLRGGPVRNLVAPWQPGDVGEKERWVGWCRLCTRAGGGGCSPEPAHLSFLPPALLPTTWCRSIDRITVREAVAEAPEGAPSFCKRASADNRMAEREGFVWLFANEANYVSGASRKRFAQRVRIPPRECRGRWQSMSGED